MYGVKNRWMFDLLYRNRTPLLLSKVGDLKKAQEKGKKIALLHNHPGSSIPSASDLVSLSESGASLGIAACHNASIYTFKKTKEPDVGYNIDEESIDLVMTVWGDRDQDKLFAAIEERFGIRIEYYS